ncbi:MazG-like family protein [Fictibacillus gelatini]|uniref:MazG-like family protein n=1 Tax=Fictibacillus gelatini TaxID=225985 RepID=UPI00040BFBA3|nr:MazG-like family protein [Fictibacillus gelatini]
MEFRKDINDTLIDIGLERYRQESKWGKQRHHHGTWLAILGEEYGEVCQAMQKGLISEKETDADDLYNELIQVAAVACAIAEQVREEREDAGHPRIDTQA